jgi:hypothetical protein
MVRARSALLEFPLCGHALLTEKWCYLSAPSFASGAADLMNGDSPPSYGVCVSAGMCMVSVDTVTQCRPWVR